MIHNIRIISHRGIKNYYPENTLLSFTRALDYEIDGIEFDIHYTKDRKIAICHDATVDRTSNGTGKICDMTLAELKKLDFGAWMKPDFAGERIPTFDETLDLITPHLKPGFDILIEQKDNSDELTAEAIEIINKRGIRENCIFLSFFANQLELAHKIDPNIRLHSFPSNFCTIPRPDLIPKLYSICIWNNNATPEEIDKYHKIGLKVDICPVDNQQELEHALASGPDSITSNATPDIIPILKQMP